MIILYHFNPIVIFNNTRCESHDSELKTFSADSSITFDVAVKDLQYTATLSYDKELVCEGVLEWNNITDGYCGKLLISCSPKVSSVGNIA